MSANQPASKPESQAPFFQTRGVVLVPDDLTLADWPERAKRAGLNTIALHPFPGVVTEFVKSDRGQAFLQRCAELGLEVEYELHAMGELLPRELFEEDPALFRMAGGGERTPDANLCVHSERALGIVAEHTQAIARVLKPTTSRYFFWGDDGKPWCRCPKCRELSESDQALLLEVRILEALREIDAKAQLAHLAYLNTLEPPTKVAPHPGIFLEYAPIRREFDVPLDAPDSAKNQKHLRLLEENLALFGADSAQALEYWLDCSLFSKWKEPHVKLPWNADVLAADLDVYGSRGVRHITTFAVYLDANYVKNHGEPPIQEYGDQLTRWPKRAE